MKLVQNSIRAWIFKKNVLLTEVLYPNNFFFLFWRHQVTTNYFFMNTVYFVRCWKEGFTLRVEGVNPNPKIYEEKKNYLWTVNQTHSRNFSTLSVSPKKFVVRSTRYNIFSIYNSPPPRPGKFWVPSWLGVFMTWIVISERIKSNICAPT